jgi:hypothetical protein
MTFRSPMAKRGLMEGTRVARIVNILLVLGRHEIKTLLCASVSPAQALWCKEFLLVG